MRETNIVAELQRQLQSRTLVEEEDFAHMIVESTIDGIYTYDTDLVITLWNKGMERITGRRKEDVLGQILLDRFPFLRQAGLEPLLAEPLKGNATPETEGPWYDPELKRGGYNRRRSCPLRNEMGEVVGGLVIVHEITEQKRAESEVAVRRKAEERLKFLSDTGMLLSGTLEYAEVLDRVIALSTRHFEAWCKLRLVEDDESHSVFEGHQDPVLNERFKVIEAKYPPPPTLTSGPHWVLKNGGHQFLPDFKFDPATSYSQEPEFLALLALMKAYICVPVEAHGRILGTYSLVGTERAFTEEDLSLAHDLARWIGLAIANARAFARKKA